MYYDLIVTANELVGRFTMRLHCNSIVNILQLNFYNLYMFINDAKQHLITLFLS